MYRSNYSSSYPNIVLFAIESRAKAKAMLLLNRGQRPRGT